MVVSPFSSAYRKKLLMVLLAVAISLYILEGVLINPFIIWTLLPIYVGFGLYSSARKSNEVTKMPAVYGFLIVSLTASYAYHIAWFFDIGDMKTSSSTSALIFIFFPVYCVILGYAGWLAGFLYVWLKSR